MHLYLAALFAVAPASGDAIHPLTETLRSMPEVASVAEHRVRPGGKVIIHLRDWHYVAFESFSADVRDSSPGITGKELRDSYRQHLRDVQAVQAEQRRVIRRLLKSGVRTVYLEGLTPEIEPVFPIICDAVCADANPPLSSLFELPNRLAMKSAGQLLAAGEALTIRAADTEQSLAASNPTDESGTYRAVPRRVIEKREDTIVRAASRSTDRAVLLLLGGGHDLTDNVVLDGAALIVVSTHQYVAMANDK